MNEDDSDPALHPRGKPAGQQAANALDLIHVDEDLLVVSKPAGMMVHRNHGSGRRERFLLQTAAERIGAYLYPVHRLDRNTTGVVCFARSSAMARALQEHLADAVKSYIVLARGETAECFRSDRPLSDDRGIPRTASTEFQRIGVFSRSSLLTARLMTGRRHQIRRHLNHLGHHVVGDTTHGKGGTNRWFRAHFDLPRMFLHAERLEIAHPRTATRMTFTDPLAQDLRDFLNRLPDVPPNVMTRIEAPTE